MKNGSAPAAEYDERASMTMVSTNTGRKAPITKFISTNVLYFTHFLFLYFLFLFLFIFILFI